MKLHPRQVGNTRQAGTLKEQLADLDSKISGLGFVKGVVDTRSNLPLTGNVHNDLYLVSSESKLLRFEGSTGLFTELVSTDPMLTGRVSALEANSQNMLKTYIENFLNAKVDSAKTNAVLGTGYVKAGRIRTFVEGFDTTDYMDASSSGITIANGKLTLQSTSGSFVSKPIATDGTSSAMIEPTTTVPVVNAFTQNWNPFSPTNFNNINARIIPVIDKVNNRTWYMGANEDGGAIYVTCVAQNGTTVLTPTTVASSTVKLQIGTSFTAPAYSAMSGAIDNNGNLWMLYAYYNNSSRWSIFLSAIKPDGTMYKPQVEVMFTTNDNRYGIIQLDINVHPETNYVFIGGAYAGSPWTTYYQVWNATTGTQVIGNTNPVNDCINGKFIYDPVRKKMALIGCTGSSNGGHTVFGMLFNGDGTIYKGVTSFLTTIYTIVSEVGTIYDPDLDQFVTFWIDNGNIRMLRLNPDTLSIIQKKSFGADNLCRWYNKPTSETTASSYYWYNYSQYNYNYYYPWMAVDGVNGANTTGWDPNVTTQAALNNEWWKTDLGDTYDLKTVKLYMQQNSSTCWISSATVALSTDNVNFTDVGTLSFTSSTDYIKDLTFTTPISARYIKVYKMVYGATNGNPYAGIAEVEAYQDPNQTFSNRLGSYSSIGNLLRPFKDGQLYYLTYWSLKESSYTNIHYSCINQSSSKFALNDITLTNNTSAHASAQIMYRSPRDNNLRLCYNNGGGLVETVCVATATTVSYFLSNDGITWLPATSGQTVNFASTKNQVYVKINMTSPQAGITPEVAQYTLTQWTGSPPPIETSTFITGPLPAVYPVTKATMTVSQTLGDGTITWYMSNDGGNTWVQATPGQDTGFTVAGGDFRVKIVFTCPINSTNPPVVTQYNIVTSTLVQANDLATLQTNLVKTNFKLDSHTNASKNGMKNLIIDAFNDTTGIDAANSVYTFDSTLKCVSGTTVQSTADTTSSPPTTILLYTDETLGTGTIVYQVSRNGGISWDVIVPGIPCPVSGQPMGTSLVMKALFTGNAKLNAWAYSWS